MRYSVITRTSAAAWGPPIQCYIVAKLLSMLFPVRGFFEVRCRIWSFFRFVFFLSSYGSQRDTCGFGLDSSMLRLHLHLFQETSRSGVQLNVLLLSMHARDHLRKSGRPRGNNLGVRHHPRRRARCSCTHIADPFQRHGPIPTVNSDRGALIPADATWVAARRLGPRVASRRDLRR